MGLAVSTIREKLHNYIDHVEDKKLKAFYTIMQADIEEEEYLYTKEVKDMLNERYEDYKSGKSKMVTAEESKKRIQKLLKKQPKK